MFKPKSTLILCICIVGAVGTVSLKLMFPSFAYFTSLLWLILLLTIFFKTDIYTYLFAIFTLVIIFNSMLLYDLPVEEMVIKQVINVLTTIATFFVVMSIKKSYRLLDRERKQMNALFEFAGESIILTNSKGEILLVNPEAQRLFSYDASEMAGKQIEMLVPERYYSVFSQYRADISNPRMIRSGRKGMELFAIKKSGEEFPIEVSLNGYEQQKEFFILTFIADLTEHKATENKLVKQKNQLEIKTHDIRIMNIELENKVAERTLILQEALQELEKSQTELSEALSKEKELSEIKSRFVSMASHEFRTPLSTILSSASLLTKYQLNEEQVNREKHIKRIKDSVKHLNDMLEDFLNLGKLEEGRVFTEVETFDVQEFLQDVFDEMKISLKIGQQLKLSFEGVALFATDKRLLKNVLINLLSNAIKFSDMHTTIEIAIDNSPTFMILQVKDRGIGIAKEDLPHLFSTFYRGKNAVNIQGTGLGLHIIKRYVDMLEGTITLSTELNEGTTFNVGLPNLKELIKDPDMTVLN